MHVLHTNLKLMLSLYTYVLIFTSMHALFYNSASLYYGFRMDQTGSASIDLNEFQEFMLLYPSSDVKDMVDFWRHNLVGNFHKALLKMLYLSKKLKI